MGRQIAISDIHGCAATFRKLVMEVVALTKEDTLYLLGDYINKGPDAKGVLDFIFELYSMDFKVFSLRGNHEQYLIDVLNFPEKENKFLFADGRKTLESFGVPSVFEIPSAYLDFIEALPYYLELEKYILVHAGFNFELENPFTDKHAMLNIREMMVDFTKTGNRPIIHGHVPTPLAEIKKALEIHAPNICIDGGCVYRQIPNLENLVALELDTGQLLVQPNIDLTPQA